MHLQRAIRHQKARADCYRSGTPVFAPGDRVWLSTRNLPLHLPCRKLGPRFVGPFKVPRRLNEVCYRLQLTPDYRINTSFHVSLLRPVEAGPLQESEVREVPTPPRGGPGVCCSSHTGLEASGEGPSVPRGVGGVRSGGEMLGAGGGRVSSTVSIQIALRLALRVIPKASVGALLEPRLKGRVLSHFTMLLDLG